MKGIIAIIVVILLVAVAMPSFAQSAAKPREETLFQMVSDSIAETGKRTGPPPSHEVDVFENAKKTLSSLDDSSAKAKALSLRNNPGELKRRNRVPEVE